MYSIWYCVYDSRAIHLLLNPKLIHVFKLAISSYSKVAMCGLTELISRIRKSGRTGVLERRKTALPATLTTNPV